MTLSKAVTESRSQEPDTTSVLARKEPPISVRENDWVSARARLKGNATPDRLAVVVSGPRVALITLRAGTEGRGVGAGRSAEG